MSSEDLLKGISMKTLGFAPKTIRALVEGKKSAVFLARINGVAAQYFTGENGNGEWVGFRGRFIAVNYLGEVFESGAAFFPVNVSTGLRKALDAGASEVEVKADVYAIESEKNASGYAYICEPVMTQDADDKLKRMKSDLKKGLPSNVVEHKKLSKA